MSANNDDEIRDEDKCEDSEFDELAVELLRRLYRQQPVDWDDYYRQYPQRAEKLKNLRPAMEALATHLRQKPK